MFAAGSFSVFAMTNAPVLYFTRPALVLLVPAALVAISRIIDPAEEPGCLSDGLGGAVADTIAVDAATFFAKADLPCRMERGDVTRCVTRTASMHELRPAPRGLGSSTGRLSRRYWSWAGDRRACWGDGF
jgi:hypothetical protein